MSQATSPLSVEALASQLMAEYEDAEKARTMVQERWLDDLRQYRGQYAPGVKARLTKSKKSQVFYRLTTYKVNTMVARLMDLLFPQPTKNWSIEASPDPMLPDEIVMEAMRDEIEQVAQEILEGKMQELEAQQIIPDLWAQQKIMAEAYNEAFAQVDTMPVRQRIAKDRASAMEQVINDQLAESRANGSRRKSWQQSCREVVKSSCLYGMGVLKGPLVEKVDTKQFRPTKDQSGNIVWEEQVFSSELRPFHEAVSIWDVFPDPGARLPEELRFVWQLHLMTDKDLLELTGFPGFSEQGIRKYMAANPDGDAQLTTWEAQIRDENEDNASNGGGARLNKRYRVKERWGYLSGHELAAAGAEILEEDRTRIYSSSVWLLGDTIIKAMLNPIEGVHVPYHFYPYQQDDTSFWPEGIAAALRAPQAGINAAVRAMQDNAGVSSGPIYGINVSYLKPGENPLEMAANRVFLFEKPGITLNQAFQAVTVPSCINENLSLVQFWRDAADEMSTPRFNQGDGNLAGAGKTASGLSMLMGASNILLKDHIKDFDDCIVSPFINAMFRWNMQWNEDESIKGDFNIVASGSQSFVAKEIRAQQVPMLINYLGIPQFARFINDKKLLEVAMAQTDLPAHIILRSDDEAAQYEQQQMQMQAKANAEAQVAALVEQLQKQGMTPEQINGQMMALIAQTVEAQAEAPPSSHSGGLPQ